MEVAALCLVVLIGGSWGLLRLLRRWLHDDAVPELRIGADERFLLVFAHPDDEITVVGTAAELRARGLEVSLLTLTCGEAGDSGGLLQDQDDVVSRKKALGELRKQELACVGELLGLTHQETLAFPDSELEQQPADAMRSAIRLRIEQLQPTSLISFDEPVGLYGHPDHRAVARHVADLCRELSQQPGSSIRRLLQVTLPEPMIRTALRLSSGFRRNYPTPPAAGLPSPTSSVRVWGHGGIKKRAMQLHRSQQATFDDMQPGWRSLPAWFYFLIWDKEYFAELLF